MKGRDVAVWLALGAGLVLGATLGVLVGGLLAAASRADEHERNARGNGHRG